MLCKYRVHQLKQEHALNRGQVDQRLVNTVELIPENIVFTQKNEEKFFKLLCVICKNEMNN